MNRAKATEWLYFVLDGALVVHTPAAPRIAVLKAGDVVGEISFVDARPPVASVRAEVESKVGAVPRAVLSAKLRDDVGFAARFYRALAVFLADRLRTTTSHLGTAPYSSMKTWKTWMNSRLISWQTCPWPDSGFRKCSGGHGARNNSPGVTNQPSRTLGFRRTVRRASVSLDEGGTVT